MSMWLKRLICISVFCTIVLAGCAKTDNDQSNTELPTPTAVSGYSDKVSLSDFHIVTDSSTKVILDCDMSYVNDDAFAMMFLAQADKLGYIDLLGVAVSGGNKTGAVAVNVALLQLEAVGRTDIPVYIGRDEPLHGFNTEWAAKQDYAGDV